MDSLTEAYTNTLQEKNDLQEKINYLMENQNDYIERLHELDDLIIEYQDKIDDIEEKSMAAYSTIAEMLSMKLSRSTSLRNMKMDSSHTLTLFLMPQALWIL